MFVFDAEQCPYSSATHFREANEEAEKRRVLQFAGEDGIEDPIETEYGVEDHGCIVHPGSFVAENIAQERVLGVGVAKT